MAAGASVQRRALLHRRIGIAALLIAVVVITMLITFDDRGADDTATPDIRNREAIAQEVAPVGAGVTRTVASSSEWQAAVQAAQPGDVIRLTATIGARLVYRGGNDGGVAEGANGTAGAPIVITADPGVWIDPGDKNSGVGALDILYVDHVHAVGVRVRNAQFGIRCTQCHGSSGSPVRIAANTVTEIGHAGIHIAGHWSTHAPSDHVLAESNVVTNTGRTAARYGEGIYIGYGSTEWVDTTSNVTVRDNEIAYTGAEGVDVKPGTREIVVENNRIHDLAPIDGGAISAHYVNATANPHPNQLDRVIVRGNRIWNQNLDGVGGANDWAIWVGHGGVEIRENVVWGLRNDPNKARGVRVRATQVFGPHQIVIADNVFWTARGWLAELSPSGAGNVVASGNRGPDGSSNEITVGADAFVGPVPSLGAASSADNGGGPGSAFAVAGSASPPTTSTSSPAPTSAPTSAPATTQPPDDSGGGSTSSGSGDSGPQPLTTVPGRAPDGGGSGSPADPPGRGGGGAGETIVGEAVVTAGGSSPSMSGLALSSTTQDGPVGDLAFADESGAGFGRRPPFATQTGTGAEGRPAAFDLGLDLGPSRSLAMDGGAVVPAGDGVGGPSDPAMFGLVLLAALVSLASYLGIRAARLSGRA